MKEYFKTILIPVDFSDTTELAVRKAVEIADAHGITIHLLHVRKPSVSELSATQTDIESKLKKTAEWIRNTWAGVNVQVAVVSAPLLEDAIAEKARALKANLVVLGKRSRRNWFSFFNTVMPSALATKAGCAVLTVKPGALKQKIRNVIVPVQNDIPYSQVDAIAALSRKNKIRIFLVTFMDGGKEPHEFSASVLLRLYQWLRNTFFCQVEYAVLQGANRAKAILDFAEKNEADILLIGPGTETKIGWPHKHISDIIPATSKVQVLAVWPAKSNVSLKQIL